MAVQNLISFEDSPKTLNECDIDTQCSTDLQSTEKILLQNDHIKEEDIDDSINGNMNDNLNENFNLNHVTNDFCSDTDNPNLNGKINNDSNNNNNGLLQLSDTHFNKVLLERKPLEEVDQVRPHPSKRHVGVFWDIQNCCISQTNQVGNVVQNIRDLYSDLDAIEGEFAVVCDVFGVNKQVLSALNNLQANIFHVCSYSKNACDEKLKQLIYRFVALYDKSSIVILISSDINFAPICSDLKYRQQVHIILVHSVQVSSSLIVAANECRSFEDFRSGDEIEPKSKKSDITNVIEIIVTIANWPSEYTLSDAETLLTRVSQNVGGKVVWVNSRKRFGIVLFKSITDAQRCVQNVHNRKLRGSTLIAKILHSDDAHVMSQVSSRKNFENDLIQIIEKMPKLEVNIIDLHQELLQKYPERYHFVFQEFVTFLEAYKCKRIVQEKNTVRLNTFHHIIAIGIRMLKIFQTKNNPITVDVLFDNYIQLYRLEINDLCAFEIWALFRNIFWIFARIGIVKNIVLLKNCGIDSVAKFENSHWACETAKIFSVLRSRKLTFQQFYYEYSSKFDSVVSSSTFWYERFKNVFILSKDDKGRFQISATPLYQFVERCLIVLLRHFSEPVCSFEDLNLKYWDHFGVDIPAPLEYGFTDLASLFENIIIFKVNGDLIHFEYRAFFKISSIECCNYCSTIYANYQGTNFSFDDNSDLLNYSDCEDDEDYEDNHEDILDYYEEESGEISDNEDSDSPDSVMDAYLT